MAGASPRAALAKSAASLLQFNSAAPLSSRRCQSSSGEGGSEESSSTVDPVANLHEEISMLTDSAIPIGTLFKTLSPDARKYLNAAKLPLETFLLRHPGKYALFRKDRRSPIMVSRFGTAPETSFQAVEKTKDQIFDGKPVPDAKDQTTTQKVYTVLKYIPNEWVGYVSLNIPDPVRKQCIGKPAKKFFEANPRYFEVRIDETKGHTFDVRRSIALQEYMAEQQRRQTGGGGGARP